MEAVLIVGFFGWVGVVWAVSSLFSKTTKCVPAADV